MIVMSTAFHFEIHRQTVASATLLIALPSTIEIFAVYYSFFFNRFLQHHSRHGPEYENSKCDRKCRDKLICSLLTSEAQLIKKPQVCKILEKKSQSWLSYIINEI